jgi:hypothetical protein
MNKSLPDFAIDNDLQFSADAIEHFFYNDRGKDNLFNDVSSLLKLGYAGDEETAEEAYHQASKYLFDLEFKILSCLNDEHEVVDEQELAKLMKPLEELMANVLKSKRKSVKEEVEYYYWEADKPDGGVGYLRTAIHQTRPYGAREISKELYDRMTAMKDKDDLQEEFDRLTDEIETLNDELEVASSSDANLILNEIKDKTNQLTEVEKKLKKEL